MNIGQLARQTQVPIDTIRYYERQRLLPEPPRSTGGYRRYAEDDVSRLNFIRRAKGLGFTLEEIGELLAISAGRGDMAAVKDAASRKLSQVEQRIDELARVRDALKVMVDACPGHGALRDCPIVSALREDG
ncbi:Cu(I)-responsive transcriptional regulator/Hg(II)-responsive transcriptional regulator,TIGR02051 [Pseudoxanthomonas sp. GM95]|uniref:MerR family transcriptional regulator n=1 Tax=Pseudoxanthomonas sp. GM95 TaxID=1881043 RepID=UPI0008B8B694|nr:MerR family transcriptional regulator [Pseudoxanthomonas sp. GM95]SEL10659.1 Cu(I)-responsive transcriptional regulator/Hg(II)-responsive transcriptional regulator,TIGR02051 [Pseudoxanthomonas sp. GM95]